jgi:hypothetical protein
MSRLATLLVAADAAADAYYICIERTDTAAMCVIQALHRLLHERSKCSLWLCSNSCTNVIHVTVKYVTDM